MTFSCQFLEKPMKNYGKNKYEKYFVVSVSFKNAVITLYINIVLNIFTHFKSGDVSVLIGMRRLKSKAIQS